MPDDFNTMDNLIAADKIKASKRQWAIANRDKIRGYQKAYRRIGKRSVRQPQQDARNRPSSHVSLPTKDAPVTAIGEFTDEGIMHLKVR